jgi:hypothetical protein
LKLAVNQSYGSKLEVANLEFALPVFLIKLTVAEPVTKPVPPGSPIHPLSWSYLLRRHRKAVVVAALRQSDLFVSLL